MANFITDCNSTVTCNNHGECDDTGKCDCDPRFDGSLNCGNCAPDHYNYPSCFCKSN